MDRGARPTEWEKAAALLVLLSGAAWAQAQIPDSRFPGINMDTSKGGVLCNVCGEIRSIREVYVGTPLAPATLGGGSEFAPGANWRVVGNVLSLPIGPGSDERPRVGSAGTPEMNARFAEGSYEISILMDNGERRTVQRRDGSQFQVGDRVTMRAGDLELMYPR
jgi:outer membrane lipoprotein SlyB